MSEQVQAHAHNLAKDDNLRLDLSLRLGRYKGHCHLRFDQSEAQVVQSDNRLARCESLCAELHLVVSRSRGSAPASFSRISTMR